MTESKTPKWLLWLEGLTRFRGIRYPDEWWERRAQCRHPGKLTDREWRELGRLWQWLWMRHVATLSRADRDALLAGTHASQTEGKEVLDVLTELRELLKDVDYIEEVGSALYHFDMTILYVDLKRPIPAREYRNDIPGFFRGYHVKVHWPNGDPLTPTEPSTSGTDAIRQPQSDAG
ncbi:MAG: hypothetical protein IT450_21005 [Phycisphaerales bacterium]|nr:hypothetical protein [Phycisphaerales bacterium]